MQEITLSYLRDIHRVSLPKSTSLVHNLFFIVLWHSISFYVVFIFAVIFIFVRPSKGALGQLELPRQHSDSGGRKQTALGDPNQWRTSTTGGVDEGREGELQPLYTKKIFVKKKQNTEVSSVFASGHS